MFRLSALALFAFFLASGCDGPVGAIDRENGITAELTGEGIRVTNEFEEQIYIVAYGEEALATVFPASQTVDTPGRPLSVGETTLLRFADEEFIQRGDDFYTVSWITVKGDEGNRFIGPRGELELMR